MSAPPTRHRRDKFFKHFVFCHQNNQFWFTMKYNIVCFVAVLSALSSRGDSNSIFNAVVKRDDCCRSTINAKSWTVDGNILSRADSFQTIYKSLGNRILLEAKELDIAKKRRFVYGINEKYFFKIDRRDDLWLLSNQKSLDHSPDSHSRELALREFSTSLDLGLHQSHLYQGIPSRLLISRKPIEDAAALNVLDYQLSNDSALISQEGRLKLRRISLTFDLVLNRIVRTECEGEHNGKIVKSVSTFIFEECGISVDRGSGNQVATYQLATGPFEVRAEWTFENRYENFSPTEFTLSHYGLPEPEGVVWEKPTPNYVWFIVGGSAFVVMSVLAGWLKRRYDRRSVPGVAT